MGGGGPAQDWVEEECGSEDGEEQEEEEKKQELKEGEKKDKAAAANVLKRDLGLLQASIHCLSVGACICMCSHVGVHAFTHVHIH